MSVNNLTTLKGIFPEPKTLPKRDFLKENKLKLKALQKTNARNLRESNNGTNEEHFTGRRYLNSRQTMIRNETTRLNSGCSCGSKKPLFAYKGVKPLNKLPRKLYSDKGIQTDDIADEVFLSKALQKCSLTNVNSNLELKLPGSSHSTNSQCSKVEEEQRNDIADTNVIQTQTNGHDENDNYNVGLPTEVSRPRSSWSHLRDTDDKSTQSKTSYTKNLKQLKTNDILESANHKHIKIPKYLEREKRERELKRLEELTRDPNCPIGHYVLSAEEKRDALSTAQEEFRKLVDELNRMPLTTQTLRIRNRKVEIEKTLAELENTIRMFSKQKVYVKIDR